MESAIQIGSTLIDTPTLVQKMLQYRLLEKFVKETVIDELTKDVACDPVMATEAFCQRRQLQTGQQRQEWCKQEHFSPAQMQAEAVREYRLNRFKEETWGDRLQTFFLQRKDQLDRVIYSLIRTKDTGLAQELYFRLCDDGENFAALAKQYSEGKEAQTGGLAGPVEMSVPHPALGKMLRVSSEGQLWPPTQIGEWMIIVRFEKLIPAQLDAPMRQRLLHEQFQALLQQQMQASPVKLMPKPVVQKQNLKKQVTKEQTVKKSLSKEQADNSFPAVKQAREKETAEVSLKAGAVSVRS